MHHRRDQPAEDRSATVGADIESTETRHAVLTRFRCRRLTRGVSGGSFAGCRRARSTDDATLTNLAEKLRGRIPAAAQLRGINRLGRRDSTRATRTARRGSPPRADPVSGRRPGCPLAQTRSLGSHPLAARGTCEPGGAVAAHPGENPPRGLAGRELQIELELECVMLCGCRPKAQGLHYPGE